MRTFALLVALLFGAATVGESILSPSHADAGDNKTKKKANKTKKKSDKVKKKVVKKLATRKRRRKASKKNTTEVESVTAVYLQTVPLVLNFELTPMPAETSTPPTTPMPTSATALAVLMALTEGDYVPLMADVRETRTFSVRKPFLSATDYIDLWSAYTSARDNTASVDGTAVLSFATIPGVSYVVTCRMSGANGTDLQILEANKDASFLDDDWYTTAGTARLKAEWDDIGFVHVGDENSAVYYLLVDGGSFNLGQCDVTPIE